MYLKTPDRNQDGQTIVNTVEDVEEALRSIDSDGTVDMDLGYPSVEFPDGTSYEEYGRVQQALQAKGFSAY